MNFYHGTTLQNAIRIVEMGFLPINGYPIFFKGSRSRLKICASTVFPNRLNLK